MDEALAQFHIHREVFKELGVRPDGISLPRQHSLVHYVRSIKMFGSPNGLCSSITESKHIPAVKRPWRRSNRNQALLQVLQTNTRMAKLAAARVEFGRRGMLSSDVLTAARVAAGLIIADPSIYKHPIGDGHDQHDAIEAEVDAYEGPRVESFIELARRAGVYS